MRCSRSRLALRVRSCSSNAAVAAVLALTVASVGCTEHSVGPARTSDDFERKARTTAQVARSAVETVRLLAETAAAGNASGPYVDVSISEQEDTLAGAQGDFDSVQPPNAHSDDIRDQLDEILASAVGHLADVRIAARRGGSASLAVVADPLAADSAALGDFLESIA